MLHFNEKLEITKQYNEWAQEHDKAHSAIGVITFLMLNGILNEEALHRYCDKFINTGEDKNNDNG